MSPAQSLSSFPRPNIAVDLAVLTIVPSPDGDTYVDGLNVLVLRQDHGPRTVLPGRFVRERETIEETIREILRQKLGLEPGDISPTLLRVFDAPDRDERAWTMSIAHAVTLPAARLQGCRGDLVPVDTSGELSTGEKLGYDHERILAEAAAAMRGRYELAPDPDGLLDGPFTLSELRRLHEAVLGESLRKDTFNRRMREQLDEVYDAQAGPSVRRSIGRPAQLFRKRRVDLRQADRRARLPRDTRP